MYRLSVLHYSGDYEIYDGRTVCFWIYPELHVGEMSAELSAWYIRNKITNTLQYHMTDYINQDVQNNDT